MDIRSEVCAKCRFWEPPLNWRNTDRQTIVEEGEGWTEGECRRRAPTVLFLTINSDSPTKMTDWPQTFDDNWCGEWQPLTSPAPTTGDE